MTRLQKHLLDWAGCMKCPLGAVRRNMVFLRGQVPADLLFIGEAPGVSEDVHGQPFVGPAGHLLDAIIKGAAPLVIEPPVHNRTMLCFENGNEMRVAITNLVCCFPRDEKEAGTDEPPDEAITSCQPRLVEFVQIAKPRLIVCVGSLAHRWVGTEHNKKAMKLPEGCKAIHIEHPAAILRANVAMRGLAIRRATVVLASAINAL